MDFVIERIVRVRSILHVYKYFVEFDALVILRSGQFAAVAGFWEDDAYTHGQNIKDDAYTHGTARFEEHEGVYRSVGGPDIGGSSSGHAPVVNTY